MAQWNGVRQLYPMEFTCGNCNRRVASDRGFDSNVAGEAVYVCPNCSLPSYFFGEKRQIPGVAPGNDVASVPAPLNALYSEARNCVSVGAYTSSVLACRKLLMNIAVTEGAKAGESFISYVNYLADNHYVPPKGRGWVDHIRKKGNEANHEIQLMNAADATELISFAEMLLKFIYEFPSRIATAPGNKP